MPRVHLEDGQRGQLVLAAPRENLLVDPADEEPAVAAVDLRVDLLPVVVAQRLDAAGEIAAGVGTDRVDLVDGLLVVGGMGHVGLPAWASRAARVGRGGLNGVRRGMRATGEDVLGRAGARMPRPRAGATATARLMRATGAPEDLQGGVTAGSRQRLRLAPGGARQASPEELWSGPWGSPIPGKCPKVEPARNERAGPAAAAAPARCCRSSPSPPVQPRQHDRHGPRDMDQAAAREQKEHAVLRLAQGADGPGGDGVEMAVTVAQHDETPDTLPLVEGGAGQGRSPAPRRRTSALPRPITAIPSAVTPVRLV